MLFEFWMLAQLGRELSLILYFNSGFSLKSILLGCRPFESATPSQILPSSSLPNPHFQILFLIFESAFLGLSRILRFSQFSILFFDSAFWSSLQTLTTHKSGFSFLPADSAAAFHTSHLLETKLVLK